MLSSAVVTTDFEYSDEFLAEIRNMERNNLAVEALQKLLADEIKLRFSRNYAKDTKFSDLLNQALTRYRNGTIEAAQVEASDQSILKFEPLVHLVTAAYAKNEDGVTSGLSIALVVNQDGSVDLPCDHFLNAELLDYFDENHPVNWRSAERDLPSKLHGYHLVAGSVEVQEILPRELEVISF